MEIEDKESEALLNFKVHLWVLEIPWASQAQRRDYSKYQTALVLNLFSEVRNLLRKVSFLSS